MTQMTASQEQAQQLLAITQRVKLYFIYVVISFIVMIASIEASSEDDNTQESMDTFKSNREWCIIASILTLSFTIILLSLHFFTSINILGSKVEGLCIFLTVLFWCALVVVASEPGSGVAVDHSSGAVKDGNLYYFSWGGFLTSVVLMVSYFKDCMNVQVPSQFSTSSRFKLWGTLLAATIVVLGSSSDEFERNCGADMPERDAVLCNRTIFGIVEGSIGTIVALTIVAFNIASGHISFIIEASCAAVLFILNGFGVAYITSSKGPGSPLGNLYYFSWMTFIVSFLLTSGCYEDYQTARDGIEHEGNNNGQPLQDDEEDMRARKDEEKVEDVDL